MYYTIVIVIAIIILVASLSVIGVMMTSGSNKKDFPEFQNTCPDYWTLTTTNNKPICSPPTSGINTPSPAAFSGNNPSISHAGVTTANNNNKSSVTQIDLSTTNWTSICDKSSWAKTNGIVWDGVSNNNGC